MLSLASIVSPFSVIKENVLFENRSVWHTFFLLNVVTALKRTHLNRLTSQIFQNENRIPTICYAE